MVLQFKKKNRIDFIIVPVCLAPNYHPTAVSLSFNEHFSTDVLRRTRCSVGGKALFVPARVGQRCNASIKFDFQVLNASCSRVVGAML